VSGHRLDVPALAARLDAQRHRRGLSWRAVGRETGLPPSTFSRITQGHSIEADALVTLLVWLDMDTDLVWLIEPGVDPVDCPGCGRPYQPNRDGFIRKHDCQPAAAQ
jgi:transcriptional regulator with XRE-family HTH domain